MDLRKLLSAAVLLVLLTFTAALAEVRQGAVTVNPYVGGYLFEGDQGLQENNFMFGLGLGYMLTERIALEGVFGYIDGDREVKSRPVRTTPAGRSLDGAALDAGPAFDPYRGRVNGYLYKIEGLYNFNPTGKLVPFVAAGVGGLTLDPKEGTSRTSVILDYGAGIQYFLSQNLAFRADVRHVFELNEGENNLMYTAGLAYYIGGGKPAPAPVAVTPPPPPAPAPEPAPAPKVEEPAPAPAPEPERKVEETPPPPPAPAPEPEKPAPLKKELVIDIKIEFDYDKWFVRPQYHDELARVSQYLKDYPDNFAVLEGHTDNKGTVKYNQTLSQKRAESVRKYMIDNFGVDGSKLSAKGYGELKPIATNDTEEGRQTNRRTELHIKPLVEMPKEVKETKPVKAKKAKKAKKTKAPVTQ